MHLEHGLLPARDRGGAGAEVTHNAASRPTVGLGTEIRQLSFTGPGVGMFGTVHVDRREVADALVGKFHMASLEMTMERIEQGFAITVVRYGSSEWSDSIQRELEDLAGSYLVAVSLRTGAVVRAEWTSSTAIDSDGKVHVSGWGHFVAWKRREPPRPFDAYLHDGELIASHPALAAAIEQYGGARRLADELPNASMALSYLAVEGLVTSVLGESGARTSVQDWRLAAPLLGVATEGLEHLFQSTQIGRHVDATRAKKRLKAMQLDPLNALACAEKALDLLQAYAAILAINVSR